MDVIFRVADMVDRFDLSILAHELGDMKVPRCGLFPRRVVGVRLVPVSLGRIVRVMRGRPPFRLYGSR